MICRYRSHTLLLFSVTLLSFTFAMVIKAEVNDTKPEPDVFRTAVIYDDVFLEHDTGPNFPENADRLRRLTKHLKEHPVSTRLLWTAPNEKIDHKKLQNARYCSSEFTGVI